MTWSMCTGSASSWKLRRALRSRGLTLKYAKNAIETEFPALNDETLPPQGGELVAAMWREAGAIKIATSE